MSVQLNELLKLDILSTFKVIAGFDGLVRNVCKVGILDHELGEHIDTNFIEGEFVLTNLLFIKDDIDQLEDIVRRLIRSKTGGLAIKPLYIDSIPEQVLKIADENEYPIFMYDTVYYEDIITELVNYIRKSDELHDQLVYVNDLKNESLRPEEVQKKLGYRLNPDFKNWIVTACITLEQNSGETLFSPYNGNQILGKHHKCYMDEDRIYMFFSFDEAINDESVTMNLIEATGIESSTSVGGLSSIKPIAKLNESLIEASHARQYCEIFDKKSIISFNKLGMYQMLMPLKMNPWMKSYYSRIITHWRNTT